MSKEVNKKVEQIRTFFKKNQAANHPIKDHPISKCEEYVKSLYFDMLCVIAQYENEDIENQNKFIQRIMAGSGETMPVNEHIKRAMSITPENMAEFIKQCRNNKLNEIFFIDALIISCGNGTPNKKQVEFLAEIADVLRLDKEKVDLLSNIALSILEQSSEKYQMIIENTENSSILSSTICYTKQFVNGILFKNDRIIHYYATELTNNPLFDQKDVKERWVNISHKDEVVMENQFINNTSIKFECIQKLKLVGCKFINLPRYLLFSGVKDIEIEKCTFNNFDYGYDDMGGVFSLSADCCMKVKNSLFQNVDQRLIESKNGNQIIFESCQFENICMRKNMNHYADCSISYYNKTEIKNCIFKNCYHVYDVVRVNNNAEMANNTFINCGMRG